jgi:hypothetical protein
MSHIATVQTEIRSLESLSAACRRLGLDNPQNGTHRLFGGQTATGYAVKLPGWRYPVVFDLTAKQVRYDNFNGHWGDIKQLDRLKQAYAASAAKAQASKQGFRVQERQLPDGSIQLVCSK